MLSTRSAVRAVRVASQLKGARSYGVLNQTYSAVDYNRKGDQPELAPLARKAVSESTTAGGVKVATYDEHGPVSSVTVIVKAGPRYETADAPGVSQLLKNLAVRYTKDTPTVRAVRETELRGNTLYATLDREHLALTAEFLRDDVVDVVPTLVSQVVNTRLQPWELLDARKTTVVESAGAAADPEVRIFDALHQAAFRSGLGNATVPTTPAVGSITRAHIRDFLAKNVSPANIAVVGTSVSHEDLTSLVSDALKGAQFLGSSQSATSSPSKYHGGEVRIEAGPKGTNHYVVAFPSATHASPDYHASLVLRGILGTASRVKWGTPSGTAGLLASAGSNAKVAAFNAVYSDAGLLGFHVQGAGDDVRSAASKAYAALKQAASGVADDALARGKKTAIVDAESLPRGDKVHELARAFSAKNTFPTPSEFAAAVNKVTAADVQKLAASLLKAKPTVVAYGNLRKLPHFDEL